MHLKKIYSILSEKMKKEPMSRFTECEICSIFGQGLYQSQFFHRHLNSNEHKFSSEFRELNDQWEKEKNQTKKDKLFKEMEALFMKYPKIRKSRNINIMLEMDEEERNEYLYKTKNKYKNDDLNEMD